MTMPLYVDEADMQSAFSGFMDRGGWPWVVGAANFELKHVRCRGTKHCRSAGRCMSRLEVGAHEASQATELLRAGGLGSGTVVYKLPDDSRGKKPWDCSVWRGVSGWFLVGWSCEAVGEVEMWLVEAMEFARFLAAGNRGLRISDLDGGIHASRLAGLASTPATDCESACAGVRVRMGACVRGRVCAGARECACTRA
jgi:hypothetical protein